MAVRRVVLAQEQEFPEVKIVDALNSGEWIGYKSPINEGIFILGRFMGKYGFINRTNSPEFQYASPQESIRAAIMAGRDVLAASTLTTLELALLKE